MGPCVSKTKDQKVDKEKPKQEKKNEPPKKLQDPKPGKRPPGTSSIFIEEQDYREHLPPLELTYFKKKYKDVCGDLKKQMSFQKFCQYFLCLQFDEQTLKDIYEYFCKKKKVQTMTFEILKKNLEDIICLNSSHELRKAFYTLYFVNKGDKLQTFATEFTRFLKDEHNSASLATKKKKIIEELSPYVGKSQNSSKVVEWMEKNLDMQKFRSFWLSRNLEEDEKIAYSMYLLDRDEKNFLKKQGAIINKKWIDKLIAYFESKYKVQNERKMPEQFRSQGPRSHLRKMQTVGEGNKTPNLTARGNLGGSESMYEINNRQSILRYNIIKRDQVLNRPLHPGAIDNYSIAGNFQWQIRKGLRYNHDYLAISTETFDKMKMIFGGGPRLVREILDGYFQLELYVVIVLDFQNGKLFQKEKMEFQRGDGLWKFYNNFDKDTVLLHRNPGCGWYKLNRKDTQTDQIFNRFNQTSFVAKIASSQIENFKQYVKSRHSENIPIIGDMYKNKNSKQEQFVCVVKELHEQQQVCFNILNQAYLSRKTSSHHFANTYTLYENKSRKTLSFESQKGGISNLGNTCYLGASIQGILALRNDDRLFLRSKPFGREFLDIIDTIEKKKINFFPYNFKNLIDSKYKYFMGQDQHDAHEFLSKLLQALSDQNPKEFKSQLAGQIQIKNICKVCNKEQIKTEDSTIITLPLKDYKKSIVKIDHIVDNTKIRTVSFQIEEECTAQQWIKNFEKAAEVRMCQYYEVKKSQLQRCFTREVLEYKKFSDLRIQPSELIYAYEMKLFETSKKLSQSTNYRIYTDGGKKYLSKIKKTLKQIPQEYQIKGTPGDEDQKKPNELFEIRVKEGKIIRKGQVMDFQLSRYPENEQSEKNDITISIINFDNYFREKIGHPFLVLTKKFYPISAIRQYIQEKLGLKEHCHLKLVISNKIDICELCGKYRCPQNCFKQNQNYYPIEWFDDQAQFMLIWDSYSDYLQHITRKSYDHSKIMANEQDFDNFQTSMTTFSKQQSLFFDCQKCSTKSARFSRFEKVIRWPNLLILHLSRFRIKEGVYVKNHTKWHLEKELLIDNARYELRAVILHNGQYINYGHYIAILNNFKYDDELVTPFQYKDINPEEIYLLMYAIKPIIF